MFFEFGFFRQEYLTRTARESIVSDEKSINFKFTKIGIFIEN